jgi:xanthine dehydrogenase molybdopterin-binding subunit B
VTTDPKFEVIGCSVPKIDGLEKVTGKAKFGADVYLQRMLHGKILRSKYPHAKIVSIDTSKAEKLSGVKGIVNWRDAPDIQVGMYQNDWRIFAKEKVRYLGDVVAAVAATDPDIALEALDLIDVEYEELPAVFDPSKRFPPVLLCSMTHSREISVQGERFGKVSRTEFLKRRNWFLKIPSKPRWWIIATLNPTLPLQRSICPGN